MHPLAPGKARSGYAIGVSKERKEPQLVPQDITHGKRSKERDDNKTELALIDERPLTRVSVSQLLGGSGAEFTIYAFSSPAELLSDYPGDSNELGLVLLSIGAAKVTDEPVRECIEQLRRALPEVPVVILSDCEDAYCITQAFQYGVRGYIPTRLHLPVVIEAIRLVQAGGTFLPADLVLQALEDEPSSVEEKHFDCIEPTSLAGLGMTPRQLQVLDRLRQGKSNKLIAYELEMQESTVKVHMRHIMKKLKATNRTHAALLASRLFMT